MSIDNFKGIMDCIINSTVVTSLIQDVDDQFTMGTPITALVLYKLTVWYQRHT